MAGSNSVSNEQQLPYYECHNVEADIITESQQPSESYSRRGLHCDKSCHPYFKYDGKK